MYVYHKSHQEQNKHFLPVGEKVVARCADDNNDDGDDYDRL